MFGNVKFFNSGFLFFLLLFTSFLPVFISVDFIVPIFSFARPGANFEIALANEAWRSVYDNIISDNYITMPISIFIVFFYMIFNFFFIQKRIKYFFLNSIFFGNKILFFLFCFYFFLCFSLILLTGFDHIFFFNLLFLSCFVFLYNRAIISNFFDQGLFLKVLFYSLSIMLFFGLLAVFFHFLSLMFEFSFVEFRGEIIPGYFAIYNFDQYYSLSLLLLFGFLLSFYSFGFASFSLIFAFVFVIAFYSSNDAAILSLVFLFVFFINNKFGFLSMFFINSFLLVSGLFFLIVTPVFCYFIVEYYPELIGDPAVSGIWARFYIYHTLISDFWIGNLLVPFSFVNDINGYSNAHNQFYSLLIRGGLMYSFLFYFLVIFLIFKSHINSRWIFLYFALYIGIILEPLTHQFLMLQFSLLLILSIFMNRFRRYNSIINEQPITL